MYINIFPFILFLFPFISSSSIYHHFTSKELSHYHRSNKTVLMFYYNSFNTTHQALFIEYKSLIDNYINKRTNYTFGYVDSYLDSKLLEFFNLQLKNDSGFVVYRFKEELFYVEENITHVSQIENIIMNMEIKNINWNSNGILEKILNYITGKRLGQKAYTYFTFIVCVASIVVYTFMNIWAKRMERNEIRRRFKQD